MAESFSDVPCRRSGGLANLVAVLEVSGDRWLAGEREDKFLQFGREAPGVQIFESIGHAPA